MEPAAEGYEPLSSRAAWAQRALIVVVALDAVASISAYFAYRVYQQDVVTQDDLDRTDLREGVVAVLWGVALVFAAVFFIRWFRRAYLNLPALGVTRLRFATWWSIGGWFIPIWSFFRPKQIANDLQIADSTAKARLHCAVRALRSSLQELAADVTVQSPLEARRSVCRPVPTGQRQGQCFGAQPRLPCRA